MRRSATLFCLFAACAADAQVRVVDMIPRRFSNEVFQNAEPTLAVHPRNPAIMAASSYTMGGDVCSRGVEAPIFATADTGKTWSLVCKVFVDSSALLPPGDVMLRWSVDGTKLYATMLWPFNPYTLQIRADTGTLFGPTPFSTIQSIQNVDQPDLAAIEMPNLGTRLFVSGNYLPASSDPVVSPSPGTAGVRILSDWLLSPVPAQTVAIEHRKISGQNYATRLAATRSGVVYALFFSPRPSNSNLPLVREDIVIVREDHAGNSASPFTALIDTPAVNPIRGNKCTGHDGKPGIRVARCRVVPYVQGGRDFGFQRRVSANLSLSVNPDNAMDVWVAWADSMAKDHYTLHVRRSTNGGYTWSGDLVTVRNATNPALAAGSGGNVGFLFQTLERGADRKPRWVTKLFTSQNGFRTKRSYVLATTQAHEPIPIMQPYLGDYIEMRAWFDRFYGVFSASNHPDTTNFPNGIAFQRNVDLARRLLLNEHGGTTIGVSIDPFFFAVGPVEHPDCPALLQRVRRPRPDLSARTRALTIGCEM